MDIHTLTQNFQTIENNLNQLAQASHRNTQEITVICVSKTVDIETIQSLYQLGQRHFAENRPEPFLEKSRQLQSSCPDIIWHYIGNLQRRPVKDIINKVDYLHSLDRLSLAKEIQKRRHTPLSCFLQVNVSQEASKSGFAPDELADILQTIQDYDKIIIVGLMTMAPKEASQKDIYTYFNKLHTLQKAIADLKIPNVPCHELSMGMSQDYPQAIAAGSTYLRIGSAFFNNLTLTSSH